MAYSSSGRSVKTKIQRQKTHPQTHIQSERTIEEKVNSEKKIMLESIVVFVVGILLRFVVSYVSLKPTYLNIHYTVWIHNIVCHADTCVCVCLRALPAGFVCFLSFVGLALVQVYSLAPTLPRLHTLIIGKTKKSAN